MPIVRNSENFEKVISSVSRENNIFTVNLNDQLISCNDFEVKFDIDKRRKEVLVEGIDDISETLKLSNKIKEYENKKFVKTPWMFNG